MSFNLGNSDRLPNFTGGAPTGNRNPLEQALNPTNNRGADMVLTPDHPSWHADHASSHPSASNSHPQSTGPHSTGWGAGGFGHNPDMPYSGGRAGAPGSGPFRAGPNADTYLPPGAVPQGARFDPIMPESVRQGLPGQPGVGQGNGRNRPGQNPPGHASGEPDYDELLPPR